MSTETVQGSPTKSLSAWWKGFKSDDGQTPALERPKIGRSSASAMQVPQWPPSPITPTSDTPPSHESVIFGVPLLASINAASVTIRLTDTDGEKFIYGSIPVVIAKCAAFLKQTARDTDGIFRIPGSVRRIRMLQELFDTSPDFGRTLSWDGFNQHDAANLLKRYLAMLPNPVIPRSHYAKFRDVLRSQFPEIADYYRENESTHNNNAASVPESVQSPPQIPESTRDSALAEYESLIFALPRSSRQLLLYLVDLISVFGAQSAHNRMTNYNLAAIFQPSVLTIKEHDMAPEEAQLSRSVLQFLTDNSDVLLKHVQQRAILQHEMQKRADDGASDEDEEIEEYNHTGPTLVEPLENAVPPIMLTPGDSETVSKFSFSRRKSTRQSRSNSEVDDQDDEDRKSLFRRSLMVLLPGSSPTEERPGMKRSGSWFTRITERGDDS